ncbi:MAG: PRC-barrel domain-containing protein [Gemmatimonadota bacterium]|nr:PRC-barrel domain-containing protein [Gemmatimonadota bacterium]
MAANEIYVDRLLGRPVLDQSGKSVGRIEEIRVSGTGDRCFVDEYLVGRYAALQRIAAWRVGRSLLRVFSAKGEMQGYRIGWEKMDLSDPERPRLLCAREELRPLSD